MKGSEAAYSIVEHCDWMPALLTGKPNPSKCTAAVVLPDTKPCGWKMGRFTFGRILGTRSCFGRIPQPPIHRNLLQRYESRQSDSWMGRKLGLTTNVAVAVGLSDAHMGAVGAEIKPGALVRIIGTSTCDIMVSDYETMGDKLIPGICGQVDGSVIPAWLDWSRSVCFRRYLCLVQARSSLAGRKYFSKIYTDWRRTKQKLIDETMDPSSRHCRKKPWKFRIGIHRTGKRLDERTPHARCQSNAERNHHRSDTGKFCTAYFQSIGRSYSLRPESYCGSFPRKRSEINEVIGIGGIALKSPFVMQVMADIARYAHQSCQIWSGFVLSELPCLQRLQPEFTAKEDAQNAMGMGFASEYQPDKNHELYLSCTNNIQLSENLPKIICLIINLLRIKTLWKPKY